MGKGRPRAVEKCGVGQSSGLASTESLNIPSGPVYYPTEDEFKDPLEFICKIRPEAEVYGICRIIPPNGWKPPFALDLDSFTFPTKTQDIHQLQARPASCDSKTFELEYNRFLEEQFGKKLKKRVVFEGEALDLCKLFNAVKRYGGYDKVVKEKKWGEVFRVVRHFRKISGCAKHVLSQLYLEHLYDYENHCNGLNPEAPKGCKSEMHEERKSKHVVDTSSSKRRRINKCDDKVNAGKVEKEQEHDQICEQCRSGLHGEVMLLCDRCNKGWHIYCLSPPLKQVPSGNWYCFQCLNSNEDTFGFVPGKQFSLEAFRRVADRAKRKWLGSGSALRVQIEKKFWEIVEGRMGEVEVIYGSDLDTSVYGSGFPRATDPRPQSIEAKVWDEYCCSPWNLNNLPKLKGSVLQAVHNSIAGVMVPWLYVGMLFSSFCWHFEDHCFYSMNYLHWGEPKCWYSVPGREASAFEKVMRNSLPDLFDAQPDLLFQLVTMLNPSVLQDNGVPVYSVLQEPGNFVITFPKSYHGGFNLGLNCAEAVNFAPADWLPHGGFGAELYQLYRKAAVLSHEELLFVIAKSDCDIKKSPYLGKELRRVYKREKTWREQLWRNGIVRSSLMPPRKFPEYVGTEEDSTCIICQQYLYLSSVICRCRPSAFVCLKHWEHLCECKPRKRRLLYRHTLAELHKLVLSTDQVNLHETTKSEKVQSRRSYSDEMSSLTKKKVKSGHVTLAQLAEEWLLRGCNIFQSPFSSDAYCNALKEAEQFLWAGSEMDPVRDMAKRLTTTQKCAEGLQDCISKIETWSSGGMLDMEKVILERSEELLSFDPEPCNEPGYKILKGYVGKARALIQEIDSALSTCSEVSVLEGLYSKASKLPIHVKESEKLGQIISSAKGWIDRVRRCLSEKHSGAVDVDMLYKLKSEILELQVHVPETEMLMDLLVQAESCRNRCCEILHHPIDLKNVEVILQELDCFPVNIPELKLLKQYHDDALLWISHVNDMLLNIRERGDQDNVVNELNCILKDGAALKIQVDYLPLVEFELKKACCREKALKARKTKMSLDFVQQLMMEAVVLQIEREELFVHISEVLADAKRLEERAAYILSNVAQVSDFEDVIRSSDEIFVALPFLDSIKDALIRSKSWLENCRPFLKDAFPLTSAPGRLLNVGELKELVWESKLLKMFSEERKMLETVLKICEEWESGACSLLQDVQRLLDTSDNGNVINNGLVLKIECLVSSTESAIEAGLSLGFDFKEIPQLQSASSTLQWCKKAISHCTISSHIEDVERMMIDAENFPLMFASGSLWSLLFNGIKWLKKALGVIPGSFSCCRCKLSDAGAVLSEYKDIRVSFPLMVSQLVHAIQGHMSWVDKVRQFFSLKDVEQSLSRLLELKELGKAAFKCSELDMILSEVEKADKWKQHCENIIGPAGDAKSLLLAFLKVQQALDKSLYVYDQLKRMEVVCLCCSSDLGGYDFVTCSVCKSCYHVCCLGQTMSVVNHVDTYLCPYCQMLEAAISQKGSVSLKFDGKRPELKMVMELLSDAQDVGIWMEEKEVLQQLVEKALACKAHLTGILDSALCCIDGDLAAISNKLAIAVKAVEVAGVYDHEGTSDLEQALARNSWRTKVNKLPEGPQKSTIRQILLLLKEGQGLKVPPEDHFRKKLTELKHTSLQWAHHAKKVAADSGALGLDEVFELIMEGENLPVYLEKELELLRVRSMLYCICRKPYDQRAMIACDKCDEWYHFDCIKLSSTPSIYICPACKPQSEELPTPPYIDHDRSLCTDLMEPNTPSPQQGDRQKKDDFDIIQDMPSFTDKKSMFRPSSGVERLWWRSRKPFRRAAKKRDKFENLTSLYHQQL